MKRSSDTRTAAGGLPNFLDPEDTDEVQAADETGTCDAEEQYEYDEHAYDETGEHDAELDDEIASGDEDPLDHDPEAVAATTRPQRGQHVPRQAAPGGRFAMAAGLLVTVAASAAIVLAAARAATAGMGIEPQIGLLLGIALFAIGAGQRRAGRMQQSIASLLAAREERDEELREALAELLHHQQSGHGRAPEGHDLEHVLLSLQRQDQKINNLTKAIKMYGKPLMEIANQCTELAGSVAQVRSTVESGKEAAQRSAQRLEAQLRENGGPSAELDALPGQMQKLEVSLAAIAQRLEDSEVRKSLVRLEDAGKDLRSELKKVLRDESFREATDGLQARVDKALQGLGNGLEQLRDGNLGGLQTSVREIQREVAGIATSVAQIQASVKGGVRVAAAAPAAATVAPTSAAQAPAAAAPAATPAPQSGEADKPEASGYQTGKRSSPGKNVLGAIAKLKQMKG